VKKDDDLDDVIREERSRGRKRPVDTDAINQQAERTTAVLRILRRGTREDLRALLKVWGYPARKSKPHSRSTTLHSISDLLSFRIGPGSFFGSHSAGSLVDLGCDTVRQLLELIFLGTL
jgi:hypothetical protein